MPAWVMEGCGYVNVFEILKMRKKRKPVSICILCGRVLR